VATLALARKASAVFEERGFESPRLEAELLLAAALGMKRLDLYLQHDRPVDTRELETFRQFVRRRLRHEPIQYITGEAHFRRLVLHVDRRVLIPRPETEVLVGAVIEWARLRSGDASELVAADIGTGSGAIALSLAQEAFGRVVATDASTAALEVARNNAERLGLAERVEFREGELFDALSGEERFDAVVSNPPYVAESERSALPAEVRDWEPAQALFAPESGLALLHRLVDGAPARLRPGGVLALEVGSGQAEEVAERMRRGHAFANVRIRADLAGHDRIVMGEVAWTSC
jgi:release factor glutamine methyltransferase